MDMDSAKDKEKTSERTSEKTKTSAQEKNKKSLLDMLMDWYQGKGTETGVEPMPSRGKGNSTQQNRAAGGRIEVSSILFVDDTGILSTLAQHFFSDVCQMRHVLCGSKSCRLQEDVAPMPMMALYAARNEGCLFRQYPPPVVDNTMVGRGVGVICMTQAQARTMIERFPTLRGQVMCLDQREYLLPTQPYQWQACVRALHNSVERAASNMFVQA